MAISNIVILPQTTENQYDLMISTESLSNILSIVDTFFYSTRLATKDDMFVLSDEDKSKLLQNLTDFDRISKENVLEISCTDIRSDITTSMKIMSAEMNLFDSFLQMFEELFKDSEEVQEKAISIKVSYLNSIVQLSTILTYQQHEEFKKVGLNYPEKLLREALHLLAKEIVYNKFNFKKHENCQFFVLRCTNLLHAKAFHKHFKQLYINDSTDLDSIYNVLVNYNKAAVNLQLALEKYYTTDKLKTFSTFEDFTKDVDSIVKNESNFNIQTFKLFLQKLYDNAHTNN
jgi:hypothetical protein